MARGLTELMKPHFLLPMLATLVVTSVANSQSPDQPRREPERPPHGNPEARKPDSEQPRPEVRRPNPEQPRPEVRRDGGPQEKPRGLEPAQRRPDARPDGNREGESRRTPEARRPSVGHPNMHRRSPGLAPIPPGPRPGTDGFNELREQLRMLTREVRELRGIVEDQRNDIRRLAEQRRPVFQPPFVRPVSRPESRNSHSPQPPKRDVHEGEHRSHSDGGPQRKMEPRPPSDREQQGNPPPR